MPGKESVTFSEQSHQCNVDLFIVFDSPEEFAKRATAVITYICNLDIPGVRRELAGRIFLSPFKRKDPSKIARDELTKTIQRCAEEDDILQTVAPFAIRGQWTNTVRLHVYPRRPWDEDKRGLVRFTTHGISDPLATEALEEIETMCKIYALEEEQSIE